MIKESRASQGCKTRKHSNIREIGKSQQKTETEGERSRKEKRKEGRNKKQGKIFFRRKRRKLQKRGAILSDKATRIKHNICALI